MMPIVRSYVGGTPFRGVALSGTSGAANLSQDTDSSTATAGWRFQTNGVTGRYENGTLDPNWGTNDIGPPQEWYHPSAATPPSGLYIRATLDSGDTVTTGTLNTWQILSSDRLWTWNYSGVPDTVDGTLKIEIATDSGGSNIIATGYYRGRAIVDV